MAGGGLGCGMGMGGLRGVGKGREILRARKTMNERKVMWNMSNLRAERGRGSGVDGEGRDMVGAVVIAWYYGGRWDEVVYSIEPYTWSNRIRHPLKRWISAT